MMDAPALAASVDIASFAILARRAGLDVSDAQLATLHGVYGHVEALLVRLRGASDRARGAEPSHVFVPGQGWPVQGSQGF